MKVKSLKIILLTIFFVLVGITISNASFTATNPTVKSGENVSITVTSSEGLDSYNIDLTSYQGLTYSSCSKSKDSDDAIVSVNSQIGSIGYINASGTTKTLGTYTFKAPTVNSKTTYKVQFSIDGGSSSVESTVTVNPKETTPTENTGSNDNNKNNEENKTQNVNFKSVNQKVYTTTNVNMRSSYSTSSSSLMVISEGTEITRTGTSTDNVNGYVWSRVTYNGRIGYMPAMYLTTTAPKTKETKKTEKTQEPKENEQTDEQESKPEETEKLGLQTLTLEGITLTPEFSSDIREYTVTLEDSNIEKIEVNAIPINSKYIVQVTGNDEIKDGENTISIIVKDEEADKSVEYKITVNKNVSDSAQEQEVSAVAYDNGQEEAKSNKIIILVVSLVVLAAIIVTMVYISKKGKR